MSARRQRIEGSLLLSRFFVGKQIGIAAGIASYEAKDVKLGRSTVLKLPHRSHGASSLAAKRLLREAKASARVDHPNLLTVLDFGALADGTPFLVTEAPVGESLRSRIERERQLQLGDIVDIGGQVLSGIVATHAAGYVHGDVTSDNVHLASRSGCPPLVKLLGFGVDVEAPADAEGTKPIPPARRSSKRLPAETRAEERPGPDVDVRACGALLFEMATGLRPEGVPGGVEALPRVRPNAPLAFFRVVLRALAPSAADRYDTAFALQEALRQSVTTTTKASTPPPPPPKTLPDLDEWDDTTHDRLLY